MNEATEINLVAGKFAVVKRNDQLIVVKLLSYSKGWWQVETYKDKEVFSNISVRAKDIVSVESDEDFELRIKSEEPAQKTMAKTLSKYASGYFDTVCASGRLSKNNGDELSDLLSGMAHADVVKLAEDVLGFDRGHLANLYQGLNNGQQRMNAGNRIRSAIRNGITTIENVKSFFNSLS